MTNNRRDFIKMIAGIITFGATEVSKPEVVHFHEDWHKYQKPDTDQLLVESDLWGGDWTEEEVNASNFGFAIPANATIPTTTMNYTIEYK